VFQLLFTGGALRGEALTLLTLWQPNLQALVNGNGASATITARQAQALDSFLDTLAAAGSPALQQMIATERAALPPLPTFVGMTMEEARGVVLGYGLFLPVTMR
jgi:hypothetical protein